MSWYMCPNSHLFEVRLKGPLPCIARDIFCKQCNRIIAKKECRRWYRLPRFDIPTSYWKGKKLTEEHRRNMSEARRKVWASFSEEQKDKIRYTRMGQKHTEETRQRMSEAHKRYYALKREQLLQEPILSTTA